MNIHRELPIYLQITESLRRDILSGILSPHTKLPSEHELVQLHGVARATVRRSLARLQEEGLVYARRAIGYFVAEPKIDQNLDRLFGFSEFMVQRGMKPGSRLMEAEIQQVSAVDSPMLEGLELRVGDRVVFIRRLRMGADEPLVLANTYLPEHLFPGFLKHDLKRRSVYEIMDREYQRKPDVATQSFEAVSLEQSHAKLLKVPAGSPALLIRRTGYAGNTPVEFAIDFYRGDRTKFHVHIGGTPKRRELRLDLGAAAIE